MTRRSARVDYSLVAPTYDQRYQTNRLEGVAAALRALAAEWTHPAVLEVGCGTGRWLPEFAPLARPVIGLDLSRSMLEKAVQTAPMALLTLGEGDRLPFTDASFDLVFCVNAVHQFDDPGRSVHEGYRLLRPGGALAIVGSDPRGRRDRHYIFRYFEGAYELDVQRMPSWGMLLDWAHEAGFREAAWRPIERIFAPRSGREVLASPFLQKQGSSTLALLSDDAYAAGLRRIEAAIAAAETAGQTIIFPVDLSLDMLVVRRAQ